MKLTKLLVGFALCCIAIFLAFWSLAKQQDFLKKGSVDLIRSSPVELSLHEGENASGSFFVSFDPFLKEDKYVTIFGIIKIPVGVQRFYAIPVYDSEGELSYLTLASSSVDDWAQLDVLTQQLLSIYNGVEYDISELTYFDFSGEITPIDDSVREELADYISELSATSFSQDTELISDYMIVRHSVSELYPAIILAGVCGLAGVFLILLWLIKKPKHTVAQTDSEAANGDSSDNA